MAQEPLKILIVEDNAFFIKDFLKEGLGELAPLIDHYSSIGNSLKQLNPFHYDLAMFDYRLGEINGIELLRNIRKQGCDIPIILFTGQGDQEVAVEAMKAGANDYLTKGKLSTESVTQPIGYALGLRKEAELRKQAEEKLKKSHVDLTLANQELQASMEKLKTVQTQILRSEKLAGIGRMVAGVCHEILNPLNIIFGHSQALLIERKDDGDLCNDLNSVMEEIQRISKIISSLLKFSRKGNIELKNQILEKNSNPFFPSLKKKCNWKAFKLSGNLIQIFYRFILTQMGYVRFF